MQEIGLRLAVDVGDGVVALRGRWDGLVAGVGITARDALGGDDIILVRRRTANKGRMTGVGKRVCTFGSLGGGGGRI